MPNNSDTLERLFKEMVLKEKPEFKGKNTQSL